MKFSVEGWRIAAVCALALAHCSGNDKRLVLLARGDAVRTLAVSSAGCPAGWSEGGFDDSTWTVAQLPVQSSIGACMRARFDAGTQLGRYRWLKIDLSARSQARLTSVRPFSGKEGLGSINWSTDDGQDASAPPASDAVNHYTLDLALFPDLLQAQKNVLALQIAASARPVAITAELDVDDAASDPFVHAVKGPYLVRPSAGAARIMWETSSSAPSWLVVDDRQYDGGWAVHHDVPVSGLLPGSEHPVYVASAEARALPPDCTAAMIDDVAEVAGHASVHTTGLPDQFWQYVQRRDLCQQLAAAVRSKPARLRSAGGGTVRVVVLGDTRDDARSSGAIINAAATEAPDLVVHTGDLVAEAVEPSWQAFFDHGQPLFAQAPLAAVPGERDLSFGASIGDRFGQLFAVAAAADVGHAYSVDQGAVHVAVLDSNVDLAAQASWLDADLTQAETAGARHLFVALHQGPFSSGPSGGNGGAAALVPVALRHHVDAILSGHDNIYEHGVVSGLHYFVSGGGGDSVDSPRAISSTVKTLGAAHYLVITVAGAGLPGGARVQAKDAAGNVLDDVTLPAH